MNKTIIVGGKKRDELIREIKNPIKKPTQGKQSKRTPLFKNCLVGWGKETDRADVPTSQGPERMWPNDCCHEPQRNSVRKRPVGKLRVKKKGPIRGGSFKTTHKGTRRV